MSEQFQVALPQPAQLRDARVARAIEAISEAFAMKPSEETLRQAVEDQLTGDHEIDELIYEYARQTLVLWRTRQRTG